MVGFVSAIAAYGAFFVPRAFGLAVELTGRPVGGALRFVAYYAVCIAVTWWFYARPRAEIAC